MPNIVANNPTTGTAPTSSSDLTSWVVSKVDDWEQTRNNNYSRRWAEYYRLWRGEWAAEDKTRQVERSQLIAPALQQAIEASVAEMQESIFHRKRWFDLEEDVYETNQFKAMSKIKDAGGGPEQAIEAAKKSNEELEQLTDQLVEDFTAAGVDESIGEILLNGALYGTGIGKVTVEKKKERYPTEDGSYETREFIQVGLVAVDPNEFVIDTAATRIDNALGMAHVYFVPRHEVLQNQVRKIYYDGFIGISDSNKNGLKSVNGKQIDRVEIIEYHGLVPKRYFEEAQKKSNVEDPLSFMQQPDGAFIDDAAELVEAIVWIANRSTLLRVARNPFTMQDRSFVAFQYDTVPNSFWGRGIAEKGYNPQKALDAELRARVDSLALSTYPMMIINGAMAPRNQDYQVRPGRNVIVSGNVNEAIAPFKFPGPDPNTFRQSAELERMITVATGSLDTAAPLGVNPRNETASGISMMLGAMLKRAKRTLRNIERQLLDPLVHKAAWRYIQYDPERYPTRDYKFRIFGALGAQAREFEVAQLTQMLQTQQPGSTGYWILMKSVLHNYNMEDKEMFMNLIQQNLDASMNPQPPQPDFDQQAKLGAIEIKKKEMEFRIQQAVEAELRNDLAAEAEAVRDRGEAIWNMSEAVANINKGEVERAKAIAALVTAMAAGAGKEGANVASMVTKAVAIVDATIESESNSPEVVGVRASIARQIQEEQEPGLAPPKREVTANVDDTTEA
jgi:hypothetical protein